MHSLCRGHYVYSALESPLLSSPKTSRSPSQWVPKLRPPSQCVQKLRRGLFPVGKSWMETDDFRVSWKQVDRPYFALSCTNNWQSMILRWNELMEKKGLITCTILSWMIFLNPNMSPTPAAMKMIPSTMSMIKEILTHRVTILTSKNILPEAGLHALIN